MSSQRSRGSPETARNGPEQPNQTSPDDDSICEETLRHSVAATAAVRLRLSRNLRKVLSFDS